MDFISEQIFVFIVENFVNREGPCRFPVSKAFKEEFNENT